MNQRFKNFKPRIGSPFCPSDTFTFWLIAVTPAHVCRRHLIAWCVSVDHGWTVRCYIIRRQQSSTTSRSCGQSFNLARRLLAVSVPAQPLRCKEKCKHPGARDICLLKQQIFFLALFMQILLDFAWTLEKWHQASWIQFPSKKSHLETLSLSSSSLWCLGHIPYIWKTANGQTWSFRRNMQESLLVDHFIILHTHAHIK